MKDLKRLRIALMLLTILVAQRTFAQDSTDLNIFTLTQMLERARSVVQDNEYKTTGYETGNFYKNPLLLDGKPLDYYTFNIETKGELTVIKGAPVTAYTVLVPFYVYLRRDGNKIAIPGKEQPDLKQRSVDLSEILKYAKPEDLLIIEPVRKEDGPTKTILRLVKAGC